MARGRPRKPTALKRLEGIPGGKENLIDDEPKPNELEALEAPDWLNDRAAKIWDQLVPLLVPIGLATNIDVGAIARYCDIFDRWHSAREFIEKNGATYEIYHYRSKVEKQNGVKPEIKGSKQYAEMRQYKELSVELSRLEGQFGLTPSARAGLSVGANLPGQKDSFADKLYG